MTKQPHQTGRGTSDVWLTPRWVLNPLGPFGLDPCTPEYQPWPTAARRFTERDNGLIQPWDDDRVFMNPPYSRPLYSQFMARMARHNHGTSLLFARTETADFFRHVWEAATGLLFLEGRLFFHCPDAPEPDRCREPSDHVWRPYATDPAKPTKTMVCCYCGLSNSNSGAPSVLCAYGQADAEILASCGLSGKFVPLRLPRFWAIAAAPESWRDVVVRLARAAGGPIKVDDLYRAAAQHPKTKANPNWRAKLRQALQRGPFERIGQGEWRLAT